MVFLVNQGGRLGNGRSKWAGGVWQKSRHGFQTGSSDISWDMVIPGGVRVTHAIPFS